MTCFRLKISAPSRDSVFSHPTGTKKRRQDATNEDTEIPVDDSSSEDLDMGSETRYTFSVTKSSQCAVEFTSNQDGEGKWVKLVNSSDEVSYSPRLACFIH